VVNIKIADFWNVALCRLVDLEELVSSIFRADDGGSSFLQNVGIYLPN